MCLYDIKDNKTPPLYEKWGIVFNSWQPRLKVKRLTLRLLFFFLRNIKRH